VAGLEDEEVLELQRQIRAWRDLLLERGVPALMAEVDRTTDVAARVLAEPDGERTITDLVHIAEEMHRVFRRGRLGSLVLWLETAMEEARANADSGVEEPESRQRRLETDAAAVQVQTIHAAKGLEYPIVFVPFAWDPPSAPPGADEVPVFHEDAPAVAGRPRRRMLDVGGKSSPHFVAHQEAAAAEDRDEESRLLYVALTRARHLLAVWWVEAHAKVDETKLHELLSPHGTDLASLIEASEGTIDQVVLDSAPPTLPYRAPAEPEVALERARLGRSLDYLWRRVSFSSLSPEHPVGGAVETAEVPLRSDEAPDDEDEPVASLELPMAELPRGAAFGSLVHHVLEVVPLDSADLPGSFVAAIEEEMFRRGLEFDPVALADGLALACDTPLGVSDDAPTLHHLDPNRALKEMTFELPVRTAAGSVSLHDVGRVMLDHLDAADPNRAYAEHLTELPINRFRGYMTGAIDFTTVVPDAQGYDRFVVMDYKSNALPTLGETPSTFDYGGAALLAAMSDGNYVLQALFYQVALHRYLQWRLPEYDPAVHLGGSTYLFVRGMVGADTPVVDGARCGVARWAPPAEMIVAVSRLFAGEGL
jgi:exodeoxyribonuclease V beta subunit